MEGAAGLEHAHKKPHDDSFEACNFGPEVHVKDTRTRHEAAMDHSNT